MTDSEQAAYERGFRDAQSASLRIAANFPGETGLCIMSRINTLQPRSIIDISTGPQPPTTETA